VAPHEAVRQKAAEVIGRDRFLVAHVAAPVEWCREHDDQGIYAKADAGEIGGFPGVSADYEPPTAPDLVLKTHEKSIEECAKQVVAMLEKRGVI
jgi:bifunctional enzyme CysN/CysC